MLVINRLEPDRRIKIGNDGVSTHESPTERSDLLHTGSGFGCYLEKFQLLPPVGVMDFELWDCLLVDELSVAGDVEKRV